ncbi:hypothetical protein Pan216_29000 [Planctomycetes bacterium Pan216]|uniref:Uncharacterized protein n=1 Tax=Kolteria novifilia TaxID=2527975 RepID=A0A518B4Y4_9BACT|nr:hypothetical protein Pan216_29000 [Planctomycetes bacterium Pan216]
MDRHVWKGVALSLLSLCLSASEGIAGGHDKKACGPKHYKLKDHDKCCSKKICGPKCYKSPKHRVSACYEWKLCETEQTVFTVEYKEIKKKVKRPVIKEKVRDVSCKTCKPFAFTTMRECPTPCYKQETHNDMIEICHHVIDECGCSQSYTEMVPRVVTCLVKEMVPILVPTLEWTLIEVEDVHQEKYLYQDWEEVEVTMLVPVKTPKVIVSKVWKKCPVEAPCQECAACEAEAPCEECGVEAGQALDFEPIEELSMPVIVK